ncbi:MAG TPA: transcriptional regulator NrdR [Actinomycetaceae bacterium]|nr:transcriptional regulator NrdR [Actinomycetaceae bacterium]
MHCPFCHFTESRVVDSRISDDGTSIRRRRECPSCRRRFTTVESATLSVMKRSGASEPFRREKIITGVRKSCQGRPVTDDQIAVLAQRVEENVRAMGTSVVDTNDIGRAILGPLRELDTVAYLRFASVYSSFTTLEDFEEAIAELRRRDAESADHTSGGAAGGEAGGTTGA